MAYSHQQDQIIFFGSGNVPLVLASSAAVKSRHVFARNSVLRKFAFYRLSSGSAGKPVITLRKVTGPASTTATGTAITGGTITGPAQADGTITMRTGLNTAFAAGDHLVIHVSTAASQAMVTRMVAFVEPDWEADPIDTAVHPNNSKVYTVTG